MISIVRDLKAVLHRRKKSPDVRKYLAACRSTQVVFIHIPKTGGKSMIRALYGCDTHEGPGHAPASFYEAALGPTVWKRSIKVAVMRDPWERVYSAYRFAIAGGFGLPADEERLARIESLSFFDFATQLREDESLRSDLLMRPQVSFLQLSNGSICDCLILRTESLASDAAAMAETRGLRIAPMSRSNRSQPAEESHRIRDRETTIDIVRGVYAQDYEMLRKRFGQESGSS